MKTAVVLTALVAIAIAAPAPLGDELENTKFIQDKLTKTVNREKKSPHQLDPHESTELDTTATQLPSQKVELAPTGRTVLKKPIIVKKKVGYKVYRDSDEEHALSGSDDNCNKQVKVKLCDGENKAKSSDLMGSQESGQELLEEDDMKHSIKLAKEAVENLQRDLKKIEHKSSSKTLPRKHENIESDDEIHDDIEVARQALDHIHKHFGNLDSLSLHATATKDAESVQDIHFTIAKTEEERMAQWKEANNNIIKNLEIARNIEDTFSSPSHQVSLAADSLKEEEIKKNIAMTEQAQEKTSELKEDKLIDVGEKLNDKVMFDAKNVNKEQDDIEASPSNLVKHEMHHHHDKLSTRNAKDLQVVDDSIEKETKPLNNINLVKSADLESVDLTHHTHPENPSLPKARSIDDITPIKHDKNIDHIESAHTSMLHSTNKMKSVEAENVSANHNNKLTHLEEQSGNHFKHEIVTDHVEQLKSAEHLEKLDDKMKAFDDAVDTTKLIKAMDQMARENTPSPDDEKHVKPNQPLHDFETSHHHHHHHHHPHPHPHHHLHGQQAHSESSLSTKSGDQVTHETHQEPIMEFKPPHSTNTADALNSLQHQPSGPFQMRWSQDKNMQLEKLPSMKAAGELHNDFHNIDHHQHAHFTGNAMKTTHNFDSPTNHGFVHSSRFHDNPIAHGKSTDMGGAMMPNFHMNMRDAMELGGENPMFRWKPVHESGRSAFGPAMPPGAISVGSGGGAVGVFPNAKVGGCAIPLLLSCAPSVVSGSLAKTQTAGYAAPAYRTDDEFNFLTKRDVMKIKDFPETKLKHQLALKKQKILKNMDAKL